MDQPINAFVHFDRLLHAMDDVAAGLDEALDAGEGQKAQLLVEIEQALASNQEEMVDRVVQFILWLAIAEHGAKAQASVMKKQADRYAIARERIKNGVLNFLDARPDPKMQGKFCSLRTQKNSQLALEITDTVPDKFQSRVLSVTFVGNDAHGQVALRQYHTAGYAAELGDPQPDTAMIREYLETIPDHHVPWARLVTGRHLRTSPSESEAEKRAPQITEARDTKQLAFGVDPRGKSG